MIHMTYERFVGTRVSFIVPDDSDLSSNDVVITPDTCQGVIGGTITFSQTKENLGIIANIVRIVEGEAQ